MALNVVWEASLTILLRSEYSEYHLKLVILKRLFFSLTPAVYKLQNVHIVVALLKLISELSTKLYPIKLMA